MPEFDDTSAGVGGGVRVGAREAATFGAWSLEPLGPGLFKVSAKLTWQVPPWLALDRLTVYILRGSIRWEWDVDDVAVEGDATLVAIVTQPRIAPAGG